ncbi:hypothetical protein GCM10010329_22700 [Streptomyces spiroverticillatus]|uniref:Uncharacterized protein n=1 Tax=Streptomyces finlayi TaxID=67296 RepID=A0A918WUR1_9ACTN|nr:hypothetical protein [Streptomyces finlayi]GHA00366.1 hypothetical protein GCM10010329_22700 [Streptomyces spiroverticillatus]GHC84828.1 hypothetical protein GCM10010334_15120 [Streptomyces finlayi]
MTVEPISKYPDPYTSDTVERLIKAALATDGINAPREALAAAFAYTAEPVENLLVTEHGRDRINPARLRTVRVGGEEVKELSIQLFGCFGSTWERNERNGTRWASPADPVSATAEWSLPKVEVWRGPDGERTAALSVTMKNVDHVTQVIGRASELLAEGSGHRGYDLASDLILNGQEKSCLMVAQVYCTPEGEYWAWPTVKGNNRTKCRHQILNTNQAALLVSPDTTATLQHWTNERNAELGHADSDDHSARLALQVAVVEARLVVGCVKPELLYQTVQAGNRRDHIHANLEFSANDQDRAIGRRVLEKYRTARLIDDTMFGVLAGDLPVTDLRECRPGAGVCEQRDLRCMLLLSQFFPVTGDRRRRVIRRAMAEPEVLDARHTAERLRAYSALCSASWPVAWNPRVDDNTVQVINARAGVTPSDTSVVNLLAVADRDDDAFAELIRYRAPQWLAAYKLADPDRGSMGAQSNRSADSDPEPSIRARRGIPDVLKAMNAQRAQAVGLLREMAIAMEESRAPRRVNTFGIPDPTGKLADQAWFDSAFPKNTGSRLPKPPYVAPTPAPTSGRRGQQPLFRALPPPSDRELADRKKAGVRSLLEQIESLARDLVMRVDDARSHAAAADMSPAWEANESERLNVQAGNIIESLKQAAEGTRPPEEESFRD